MFLFLGVLCVGILVGGGMERRVRKKFWKILNKETYPSGFLIALSIFRLESSKGAYAQEWTQWEKQLREILSQNAEHLNSIQVNVNFNMAI